MLPTSGLDASETSEKVQPADKKRRYSPELKLQVVRETLEPGASVSLVARRHDINAILCSRGASSSGRAVWSV